MKVKINGFEVGRNETFIVADVGSNHKQDLTLAKESIDAISEAGANAVKFQSIQVDELYLDPDRKTKEFIKKLEFPEEWHHELKDYCDRRNITFFSSPTYLKAVDILESANVHLYKLASAQIGTFPQIVDKVASLKKPTIFSTGISNYQEVINAVKIFEKHGNDQFIILHCNSIYPTPPERVNLGIMNTYKTMFGNPVGFSDHTNGIHLALAAVTMGADVIEKHFTLDRNLKTPDCSSFAADPDELKKLVDQIRDIEKARGNFQSRLFIEKEENVFKESIRYRIVANQDLNAGEKLGLDKVSFLRSNIGLDCREWDSINQLSVSSPIKKGDIITKDKLKFED